MIYRVKVIMAGCFVSSFILGMFHIDGSIVFYAAPLTLKYNETGKRFNTPGFSEELFKKRKGRKMETESFGAIQKIFPGC